MTRTASEDEAIYVKSLLFPNARREAYATFATASRDDFAASFGRHARAKAVRAEPAEIVGLKCTLHDKASPKKGADKTTITGGLSMEMPFSMVQHVAMVLLSRRIGGAIWLVFALLLVGCSKHSVSLSRQRCDCEMLTDMDGIATLRIDLCAAEGTLAEEAIACAQMGAPANVQDCRCEAHVGSPCAARSCKVHPRY